MRIYVVFSNLMVLLLSAGGLLAQENTVELSLEQSTDRLRNRNKSLQIADKNIEWTRAEQQRLNAFWYPNLSAAGAYVHMSNKIEVKEPLNQLTDPVKDFVHSVLPDDQIISAILDKVGSYSLHFPLMPRNLTTIDANLTWPVFTGGKRIFASRIGKTMVGIAETDRNQAEATLQAALVECYYALRLGQKVVEVRKETFSALQKHYNDALKLEQNGIINKAERLFAQVSMEEARRELESAQKDISVAQKALRSMIEMDSTLEIRPVTPLFINENIPSAEYFKSILPGSNYTVSKLRQEENMASNQLKIGRAGYVPNIALFGKQTLYAHGIEKNLVPRTMVGVAFTWNIFDGLDREKRIRQAKITGESLALGKSQAITDLEVAVDKFYSQMQNAQDNVSALNSTIALSDELVRIRKKSFLEGMGTSTDVIDAEVILSKVRIAYLLAYYQYDVALINLLSTCGIPDSFHHYRSEGKTEDFQFPEK